MKTILGIRIDAEFKKLLQKLADDENRNLSNFITHAILTYIKEHKGIDWKKSKK
jgi:predicted transcriptional regulator